MLTLDASGESACDLVASEWPRIWGGWGHAHSLRIDGGRIGLGSWHGERVSWQGEYEQMLFSRADDVLLFNAFKPEVRQRNRAMAFADFPEGRRPAYVRLAHRFGFDDHDQLRVLVCDGPVLLAWVGGFRPGTFDEEDRRMLGALTSPLRARLRIEAQLKRAALDAAVAAESLEQLGAPAFVVDDGGHVRNANAPGRRWLAGTHRRALLVDMLRGRERCVRVRLQAAGMRAHWLLVVRSKEPGLDARLATAARRWGLTRRQAEVLERLVQGRANKTIAADLGCAEATVEVHVTALLEKAQVESRAELIAALWRDS
jgi:DNA-binding CsgD family transcriptional regulator